MKHTMNEFKEMYGIDLEELYDDNELYLDQSFEKTNYSLGFSNEESASDSYFNGEYSHHYEDLVCVYKLCPSMIDNEDVKLPSDDLYLIATYSDNGSELLYVVNNYDEAEEIASEYAEWNYQIRPLEEELEELNERLPKGYRAEIKREYNNSGYFHSFNIYSIEGLVYDGVFVITDDLIDEINQIEEALNKDINGWKITDITKEEGFPSWNKIYVVTYSKDGYDIEREITLDGHNWGTWLQGKPRNTIDVIKYDFDEDDLNAELAQLKEDSGETLLAVNEMIIENNLKSPLKNTHYKVSEQSQEDLKTLLGEFLIDAYDALRDNDVKTAVFYDFEKDEFLVEPYYSKGEEAKYFCVATFDKNVNEGIAKSRAEFCDFVWNNMVNKAYKRMIPILKIRKAYKDAKSKWNEG